MLKTEVEMTGRELAVRVMRQDWDSEFTCPDGLRIDFAVANRLSPYPAHQLPGVRRLLTQKPAVLSRKLQRLDKFV
jgi:hypothetical protein